MIQRVFNRRTIQVTHLLSLGRAAAPAERIGDYETGALGVVDRGTGKECSGGANPEVRHIDKAFVAWPQAGITFQYLVLTIDAGVTYIELRRPFFIDLVIEIITRRKQVGIAALDVVTHNIFNAGVSAAADKTVAGRKTRLQLGIRPLQAPFNAAQQIRFCKL